MGTPALPRIDRIRYDELADDLRRHYEVTNCRDLKEADVRLKPLKAFFSGRRASGMGGPDIERYVQVRQGAAVSNGAINRELSTLGRMLRLAYEHGKLQRVPMIHRLKEAAPRQGFFEREQFAAVRKQLPPDLQAAVTIAYTYGWRMQSEVLTLTLSQLDLEAGTLRLEPGTTKNAEGRLVYLTSEPAGAHECPSRSRESLSATTESPHPLSLSAHDRQVSRGTPPGLSQGLAHRLGTGGACGDVAP